jgi:hypothetical protein
MKTLELKDICGYLPYGLRIMRSPTNVPVVAELLDIRKDFTILGAGHIDTYRAVLRPMSDLTKGIIHRGEKFVPILALDKLNCFPISDTDKALRYYDKLNEWMFDYRGLISAGLAIDVNTLPENPYER